MEKILQYYQLCEITHGVPEFTAPIAKIAPQQIEKSVAKKHKVRKGSHEPKIIVF